MASSSFFRSPLFWKLSGIIWSATFACCIFLIVAARRVLSEAPAAQMIWLITPALLTLALILNWLVVRCVTAPLSDLNRDAELLAAGTKQALPHDISRNDEIGMLRRAFERVHRSLTSRMEELLESKDRLTAVLGSMSEGVIAVDQEDRVLFANEASNGLLGMSAEDPRGRFLIDVARFNPIVDAVRSARQTQLTQESEFRLPRGGRVLSIRATPVSGGGTRGDNATGNIVVVLRDVTDLRRLENMRSEFVANVSHELKTPLAAIQAYTETLQLGAIHDAENNIAFLNCIEEQAERLHELIVDLLQLARIESAPDAYEISDVDVEDCVLVALADHKPEAEAKSIKIVTETDSERLFAHADREGLRTILDNLIGNAVKYTPNGGQVTVRTQSEDDDILVEVIDTGIGIPYEHQQRVFERFYRVDKARSREMGGTGLGLAIVKHLVQTFGGSVGVESQPERGSRFFVRLPAAAWAK